MTLKQSWHITWNVFSSCLLTHILALQDANVRNIFFLQFTMTTVNQFYILPEFLSISKVLRHFKVWAKQFSWTWARLAWEKHQQTSHKCLLRSNTSLVFFWIICILVGFKIFISIAFSAYFSRIPMQLLWLVLDIFLNIHTHDIIACLLFISLPKEKYFKIRIEICLFSLGSLFTITLQRIFSFQPGFKRKYKRLGGEMMWTRVTFFLIFNVRAVVWRLYRLISDF